MKKIFFLVAALIGLSGTYFAFSLVEYQSTNALTMHDTEKQTSFDLSKEERNQISLCLANIFWNQLSQYSPFYDLDVVMENLDQLEKGIIPSLSKSSCQQQMFAILDKISTYRSSLNLKAAENYLLTVAVQEDVVEIVPKKVYYKVLQSGNDMEISPESVFQIHLIESRLCEGEEIVMQDSRSSNAPITLVLSDTILGFAKGAAGMATGERRKIYIHPDFAYGKYDSHGFQQLLICDVERLSTIGSN